VRTEARDIEARTQTMHERARGIVIRDQISYEAAVELAKAIKDLRAEAEAHHRPVIQAALEAHRKALEAFRRTDEPLRAAEAEIKRRIAAWTAEQERLRLEAERRAREEAERLQTEAPEAQIKALEAAGASPQEIKAAIRQAETAPIIAPKAAPTFWRRSSECRWLIAPGCSGMHVRMAAWHTLPDQERRRAALEAIAIRLIGGENGPSGIH
jgi:hypothetical protein